MRYQQRLNKHLGEYKCEVLGIDEPGVFLYRGQKVERDHILPLADAYKNILEEALPATIAFFAAHPKKRHRYFHHLNSSQAFAFDLFFPYFYGGREAASALVRALGQKGVLAEFEPEAIPALEEGSNIDMLWKTEDGSKTFCEVKFSETDFGKAEDDAKHSDKLRDIYSPLLSAHLEPAELERLVFFNGYQFYRNIWHMVRTDVDRLIFLLPKANAGLWASLEKLLSGVRPQTRDRISRVAIEDVIARLSADDECPKNLREYADKLKRKYLIPL